MSALLFDLPLLAQVQAVEASRGWAGIFDGIDADNRFVLLIIAIGCSVGIILGTFGILSGLINSIHRRRAEVDLKREMIERGMSADEIAKVIESTSPKEEAT
jgi:hypothetical protein